MPHWAREAWEVLKQTGKEFVEDKAPRQAAALAYYALLAIGPLLLVAISVAGLVLGAEAARDAVFETLAGVVGTDAADTVAEFVAGANQEGGSVVALVTGVAFILFASAGIFGQLKEALNTTWEVQHVTPEGWVAKVKDAIVSNGLRFLAVAAVALLLLAALVASTVLAALSVFVEDALPGGALLWHAVGALVMLGIVTIAFAAVYKFIPDVRISWRDTMLGAALSALLFVVGQFAIGYYLGAGTVASRYGAAGAVVAVLVWVYYSGIIFFFGAELTQVLANRYGANVEPEPDARSLRDEVPARHRAPSREGTGGRSRRAGRG